MDEFCYGSLKSRAGILTIEHPNHKFQSSPLGGTDTDKQSSSAQLACVCLSHLKAINGTKGGLIYSVKQRWQLLSMDEIIDSVEKNIGSLKPKFYSGKSHFLGNFSFYRIDDVAQELFP